MADDIVKQLRRQAMWTERTEGRGTLTGAADEIERLRAENAQLRTVGQELWAFMVVNAPDSLAEHPSFDKVIKAWEAARSDS